MEGMEYLNDQGITRNLRKIETVIPIKQSKNSYKTNGEDADVWLEKNKTKYLLEMTIDVMINPLCFVEGAYEVALFHTRELLKIDFSVETMEKVIFFHDIPEKLVEEKEAEAVAREIIKIEPDNCVANRILKNKK